MEGQARFRFKEGDLKAWASVPGAEVVVMNRWVESRLPVIGVDENEKIVTFGKRSVFALDKGDLYYVENVREALAPAMSVSRPGAQARSLPGRLPDEDMQTAEVMAPALPQVLRLEGAERVTLRGLTFAHTEWTLPKDSSGFPQAAVGVPGAVWGEHARECAFEQCTFTHLGDYALELGRGCQGNRVAGLRSEERLGSGRCEDRRAGHPRRPGRSDVRQHGRRSPDPRRRETVSQRRRRLDRPERRQRDRS